MFVRIDHITILTETPWFSDHCIIMHPQKLAGDHHISKLYRPHVEYSYTFIHPA